MLVIHNGSSEDYIGIADERKKDSCEIEARILFFGVHGRAACDVPLSPTFQTSAAGRHSRILPMLSKMEAEHFTSAKLCRFFPFHRNRPEQLMI